MRSCSLIKRIIVFLVFFNASLFAQSPKDNLLGHYLGLERVTSGPGVFIDCPNTIINIKPDLINYPRVIIEDTSCAHPDEVLLGYEIFDDSTIQEYFDLGTIYGALFSNDSLYFYRWDPNGDAIKTEFFGFKQYDFAAPLGVRKTAHLEKNILLNPNPADELLTIQNAEALFSTKNNPLLYDLNGNKTDLPIRFINNSTYKLNVSGLAEGMYFLVIETDKGMLREKFVVQH